MSKIVKLRPDPLDRPAPAEMVAYLAVRNRIAAAIVEAQSIHGLTDWQILECVAVELVGLTRDRLSIDQLMKLLRYHAEGVLTAEELQAQIMGNTNG